MKTIMEKVQEFATEKHKGQLDKANLPYIYHLKHVSSLTFSDDEKIVAWLHDTLEDTNATIEEIRALGIPERCVEAIKILTHDKSEPYFDYIRKIKENEIAKNVKWADLTHNSNLMRLYHIESEIDWNKTRKRQEKYMNAFEILDPERNHEYIYCIKAIPHHGSAEIEMGYFTTFDSALDGFRQLSGSYEDFRYKIFRIHCGLSAESNAIWVYR